MKVHKYFADFVSLIFPDLCNACGESMVDYEDLICTKCMYNLPYTDFHEQPGNIVAQQFWGKVKVEAAYALFYFAKGGKVQQLIHHLKYKNMPQVGNKLGVMAGEQLLYSDYFKGIDAIIPVPLHTSRLRKRGYNQSTCFAEGVAKALNNTVLTKSLIRKEATETQTHKSRFERSVNMRGVFALVDPDQLINKHILLVDDVVTTGATLEACVTTLLTVPGLRVSIAAIAYAE